MNNAPNITVKDVPAEVVQAITAMRRPIMISHVVPDADALGSMISMALAWRDDQRQPKVSLPEGSISQRLQFLVDLADAPVATIEDFAQADGFVVIDTAKKLRCNVGPNLKDTDWSAGRPIINIDHHATSTQFGGINWVVGGASSTCELVYYLLRAADRPISAASASLIYSGIQTDTIGYSLPTTSASALRATADAVELGADIGQIGERLGRSQTQSEFDLLRVIYDNTKVLADGRLAYSSASFDDIENAGCTAADIDDQINVPRSLDGVVLAMLFTEGVQGKTRINFRGSGQVTISELAAIFKGGGHSQAAGAILDCGINEAIEKVVPQALEHLSTFV